MQALIQSSVMIIIGLMTWIASDSYAESGDCIHLGGLRQVDAVISRQHTGLNVEVSFIPVLTFDSGTNDRINRQKAWSYARTAVLQQLQLDQQSATFVGMNVDRVVPADDRWHVYFTLKSVARKDAPETRAVVEYTPETHEMIASDLLSRKGDYLDTVTALENLPFDVSHNESEDGYALEIAGVEESQVTAFEQIAKRVGKDILLLDVEKHEVLARIEQAQTRFINRLTKLAQEGMNRD